MRVSLGLVGAALVSLAVASAAPAEAQTREVSGRVVSVHDSLPLVGVLVRVVGLDTRTTSDTAGRFMLGGLPRLPLDLVFTRVGVRSDTVRIPAARDTITVFLVAEAVQIAPLVTTADIPERRRFENEVQSSTVTLDRVALRAVPAVGEPDVMRVAQLMPGTVAKNDFTSTLNVRGGESDQNLVLLDGTTLFNPFHVGGMFSTFDPTAVERADFLTGAAPASYSGRLSGVLDVSTRSGREDRIGGTAMMSLLAGKVLFEGPLVGRSTFLVSARRSWADGLADAFTDETFTYYFADVVGTLRVPLPTGGLISATGYWGRDAGALPWLTAPPDETSIDLDFHWGNRMAGIRFEQPLGHWTLTQRASVTRFTSGIGLVPDLFNAENSADLAAVMTDLRADWGRHQLALGAAVEAYDMRYFVERPELGTTVLDQGYEPTIAAAYVDDQWRVGPVMLRSGVRVERVSGADRTTFAPRAGAKVFLSDHVALLGSVGRYHQPIHSIRDQEIPATIFEFWIGADSVTPIAQSDQGVVGVEMWPRDGISVTVEGYTRSFEDLTQRNWADDPKVRGDEFLLARGYSWGVDVLLRKHVGAVSGWVAYSFAKSVRRAEGLSYPPAHDRRHTLDIVLRAPGPFGSALGVRWGYGSPLPYTAIIGSWPHREYSAQRNQFKQLEPEVLSSVINGERYPYYSRLDLSLRWDWGTRVKWRPFLQLVNAYNRQNVFIYTYDFTSSPATRAGFSQLPVLPTFGVEVEW